MVTHPPRIVTHQKRSSALILKTTSRILMQQKAKLVYSMSRLRLATVCAPPFVIQLLKYLFETHFLQEYVIISPRSLRGRSWFLTGANGDFRAIYLLEMNIRGSNFEVSTLLPALEGRSISRSRLLGVSRASSRESKRTFLVPDWNQWRF